MKLDTRMILIAVRNHDGTEKVRKREFYERYIGLEVVGISKIELGQSLALILVGDKDGATCEGTLRTSPILKIGGDDKTLELYTLNSVYYFRMGDLQWKIL